MEGVTTNASPVLDAETYRACERRIRHLAHRYKRDDSPLTDYDEMVCAGWVGVVRALRCFDPDAGLAWEPYVYRLIGFEMSNHLRRILGSKRGGRYRYDKRERPLEPWDLPPVEQEEVYPGLHRMIDRLPDPQREVVTHVYLDDADAVALARRHGVSEAAISYHKRKALAALRAKLNTEVLS